MSVSRAMRARRWAIALALLGGVLLGVSLYANARPDGSVSVTWAVIAALSMVVIFIVGYRSLLCPACGQRLGSLADKVCRSCGAMLSDEVVSSRPPGGPAPEILEYMNRSKSILLRWQRIRRGLRHLPWIAGIVAAALALYFTREALVGAFVGVVAAAAIWLVLVVIVDGLFGVAFSVFRGRCPACRAWFTQPTIAMPGIHIDEVSLPDFCPACGERLAP